MCSFQQHPIIFELRKFGFTVIYPKDMDEELLQTALKRLTKAVCFVESNQLELADSQVRMETQLS